MLNVPPPRKPAAATVRESGPFQVHRKWKKGALGSLASLPSRFDHSILKREGVLLNLNAPLSWAPALPSLGCAPQHSPSGTLIRGPSARVVRSSGSSSTSSARSRAAEQLARPIAARGTRSTAARGFLRIGLRLLNWSRGLQPRPARSPRVLPPPRLRTWGAAEKTVTWTAAPQAPLPRVLPTGSPAPRRREEGAEQEVRG